MPQAERKLHRSFAEALRGAWRSVARAEQLAPPGNWTSWIFLGGRGSGKTRSGSEWILERVAAGERYIHLIAPTAADYRDVMIEGPAGILSIAPPHLRPEYQPSLRRLTWPNGAQALCFSGDTPDALRGPQAGSVWIDELCSMRAAQDVLDNMYFGLRVGKDPRCLITTTPRPLKCFKALLAREGADITVTRSSSYRNKDNLAPSFFASIVGKYAGTRLGRQELEAELLTDTPGALWHLDRIEELRVRTAPPFERVVVGVDPATTHGPDSDETGILVVGLGADGCGYVLDDFSGRYPPEEWARRAIGAYRTHAADRVIAEVNQGGDLVEKTLRSVDAGIPFKAVHASRAKLTRAEPVSALYEQGRVHHVGVFGPLEDQLTSYDGSRSESSPDRLDALCWAIHELMLAEKPGGFFRESQLLVTPPASESGSALGEPVERPACDYIYAVCGATLERDALGWVAFGYTASRSPLIVLDWGLRTVEGALPGFLPELATRLEGLADACGSEVSPRIFVESGGIGSAVYQTALESGHGEVIQVPPAVARLDLPARAVAVSTYTSLGRVRVARTAHERQVTFQGVTKNHLLAQITAFGLSTEAPATELFSAWSLGVLCALENPRRRA